MRLLLDLGHPAHVHLFRQLSETVLREGGEVLAAAREKDVTVELCRAYEIPHVVLSRAHQGGFVSGVREWLIRTIRLWFTARDFKPDVLVGTSMSIGLVGRVLRIPSFVFNEDDADIAPLFVRIAYPLCSYIVTPRCLEHENYGDKHLTYQGYHELAYLHPHYFRPDPSIPRSIGLSADRPYFLIRLVSLKAHHDSSATGLSPQIAEKLVRLLAVHGQVLITSEGTLRKEFQAYQFPLEPQMLHDVIAFASMVIGDSQTVATEAAMLGIPNVRCNTFVGRASTLEELEKKYGLTVGFLPEEALKMFEVVELWLKDLQRVKTEMQKRRKQMLNDSILLPEWQWRTLNEKDARA